EGGMVVTDDEALHDALCMARAHGWDRQVSSALQTRLRTEHGVDDFLARYTFYDLAYNVRPTQIAGFLGNGQLHYWDDIVSRRADNFMRFHGRIRANADLRPFRVDHLEIVSNFAMPVVAKSEAVARTYRSRFEQAGVEIRPLIAGDISQQPFFRKYV